MKRVVVKSRFFIAGVLILACALIAGGIFLHRHYANPFPADIRTAASTPLYYPSKVPYGYTINPDSFAVKRDLVIYHFDDKFNRSININVQKLPHDFDVDKQFSKSLTNIKTVITPYGPATIGTFNDKTIGNLVDGNIWIMAVYNEPGFQDDLATVMRWIHRYE